MALRFYKSQSDMSYVGQILLKDFEKFSIGKNIMSHTGCLYKFDMTFEQMKQLVDKHIHKNFKYVRAINSPAYYVQVNVSRKDYEPIVVTDNGEFEFLQAGIPGLQNSSNIQVLFRCRDTDEFNYPSSQLSIESFGNMRCTHNNTIISVVILILVIIIVLIYYSLNKYKI